MIAIECATLLISKLGLAFHTCRNLKLIVFYSFRTICIIVLPLMGVTEDYTAISDFKWGIDDRIMNECCIELIGLRVTFGCVFVLLLCGRLNRQYSFWTWIVSLCHNNTCNYVGFFFKSGGWHLYWHRPSQPLKFANFGTSAETNQLLFDWHVGSMMDNLLGRRGRYMLPLLVPRSQPINIISHTYNCHRTCPRSRISCQVSQCPLERIEGRDSRLLVVFDIVANTINPLTAIGTQCHRHAK